MGGGQGGPQQPLDKICPARLVALCVWGGGVYSLWFGLYGSKDMYIYLHLVNIIWLMLAEFEFSVRNSSL